MNFYYEIPELRVRVVEKYCYSAKDFIFFENCDISSVIGKAYF